MTIELAAVFFTLLAQTVDAEHLRVDLKRQIDASDNRDNYIITLSMLAHSGLTTQNRLIFFEFALMKNLTCCRIIEPYF